MQAFRLLLYVLYIQHAGGMLSAYILIVYVKENHCLTLGNSRFVAGHSPNVAHYDRKVICLSLFMLYHSAAL